MGRILSLDYGRRRIGMATSDPLGLTAQPAGTQVGTPEQAIGAIAKFCPEMDVELILIGLPFNMDGSEGEMAREVRDFGKKIAAKTGLPVEFQDERLTSWSAEQDLRQLKKKRRKEKGRIDSMAAAKILQDYLRQNDPG